MSKKANLIPFSLGMLFFAGVGGISAIIGGYVVQGIVYALVLIVVWLLCLAIVRRA